MKITLSLSPNYVKDWSLREAIRELLQNGLDQSRKLVESELILDYDAKTKTLRIGATNCELKKKSLLLGETDKDENDLGTFGEGYKLAILVLCRQLLEVNVYTGAELWTSNFEHSKEFNANVLVISIVPAKEFSKDVIFEVKGIGPELFEQVISKIYLPDVEDNTVLKGRAGQIYVGGLFVCHVEELQEGYNFAIGAIPLNRDRNMAHSFDVEYAASQIWSTHEDIDALCAHIFAKSPDTKYVSHVPERSAMIILEKFKKEHGNAIPVSTNLEILEAKSMNKKFVCVESNLKSILRTVGKWVTTKSMTPKEHLMAWLTTNKQWMSYETMTSFDFLIVKSGSWSN